MPITPMSNGARKRVTVAAGATSAPIYVPGDAVVTAVPGGGGSMLAQASWSPADDVEAGTASWFDWDAGSVTSKTIQMLSKATAVRFVATTQPGVGEVAA